MSNNTVHGFSVAFSNDIIRKKVVLNGLILIILPPGPPGSPPPPVSFGDTVATPPYSVTYYLKGP